MDKHRQLVLLACIDSHQSPAIRVKADFSDVFVSGVGEGDEVWLCSDDLQIKLEVGLTPFPSAAHGTRVQFRKVAGSRPLPTTIEILRGV